MKTDFADLIVHNGQISTLDASHPEASCLVIQDGKIVALDEREHSRGPQTRVIDLKGHRVIPGLNDSHLHLIRGGLNYNLELRWDGVPSLADALRMLREQVARTPAPQWVRVVGGWSEFQFAEKRIPTLEEINAIAPDTPVFILHLYCRALLNGAALRACGYDRNTPDPPGGEIQRDKQGNPTGMLIARPNATILYATLAKGPKLPLEYQINSTRQFMRELNRLGVTSCIDAGGGFQNYPDDYEVIRHLHERDELTVRIAYNLFTQKPQHEKEDFARWMKMTKPGDGDRFLRMNGAGEMLVFSAADFEDFLEPRPDLADSLESELESVVTALASNRWPFRLHATYDESITRFLDVFERVNQIAPLHDLHWFLDHCETISDRNLERVRARWRHRGAASHGVSGRVFRGALRSRESRAHATDSSHDGNGNSRWRWHRCHARRQLQPVQFALLAGQWPHRWRAGIVSRKEPPFARRSAATLHFWQRVVFRRAAAKGNFGGRPTRRFRRFARRLLHHRRRAHPRFGICADSCERQAGLRRGRILG